MRERPHFIQTTSALCRVLSAAVLSHWSSAVLIIIIESSNLLRSVTPPTPPLRAHTHTDTEVPRNARKRNGNGVARMASRSAARRQRECHRAGLPQHQRIPGGTHPAGRQFLHSQHYAEAPGCWQNRPNVDHQVSRPQATHRTRLQR